MTSSPGLRADEAACRPAVECYRVQTPIDDRRRQTTESKTILASLHYV